MHYLRSANFDYCCYGLTILGVILGFAGNDAKSYASTVISSQDSNKSALAENRINSQINYRFNLIPRSQKLVSNLPILSETSGLIKQFEGFRSSAYIDSSGLPVIGYGQTRVNGRTVQLGEYISQAEADMALEQELTQIQKIVLTHVTVDLNPYQLGALTSLVYNAGTTVITNSTLIRKLNAGDYQGAAQEFLRWNKANSGGQLVVFPGLTNRRAAEQKLFLTPYNEVASNPN